MNHDIFFAPGITIRSLVRGRPRTHVTEPKEVAEPREEQVSHAPNDDASSDAE